MMLTTAGRGCRKVWNVEEMADEFGVSRTAMVKWLRNRSHFAPDIELTFADRDQTWRLWEADSMEQIRKARKA